jgi:hypothetical protein
LLATRTGWQSPTSASSASMVTKLRVRADRESNKKRTLRLAGTEFIDRFVQHVLPCGFKRIRNSRPARRGQEEERPCRRPRRTRRPVTTARGHRVGGGVPAPRLTHRVRALPLLWQRPVLCCRGDPTARSPARSAGASVTIDIASSLAQRSDGAAVRALARPEHGKRHLPTLRSAPWGRAHGAAPPSQRIGEPPCLRPLHAMRLTSEGAGLQSP